LFSCQGLHPRLQSIKLLASLTYPLKRSKAQAIPHPTTHRDLLLIDIRHSVGLCGIYECRWHLKLLLKGGDHCCPILEVEILLLVGVLKVYDRMGVLAVIKCIYLLPTYQHFMQDIEDRCLLLTSSTSFLDLPFQEHRTTKKHHMDQNPYISSLCPKPGVVSDNMTRGDDMAKSPGPTDPRWGRPAPLLS
jgi:hypothetical protein